MDRQGVTPAELAKGTQHHYKYILTVVNGSVTPGKKCAVAISKFFKGEITAAELMGIE